MDTVNEQAGRRKVEVEMDYLSTFPFPGASLWYHCWCHCGKDSVGSKVVTAHSLATDFTSLQNQDTRN